MLFFDPYPGEVVQATKDIDHECLDVNSRIQYVLSRRHVLSFWRENCEDILDALHQYLQPSWKSLGSEFARTQVCQFQCEIPRQQCFISSAHCIIICPKLSQGLLRKQHILTFGALVLGAKSRLLGAVSHPNVPSGHPQH